MQAQRTKQTSHCYGNVGALTSSDFERHPWQLGTWTSKQRPFLIQACIGKHLQVLVEPGCAPAHMAHLCTIQVHGIYIYLSAMPSVLKSAALATVSQRHLATLTPCLTACETLDSQPLALARVATTYTSLDIEPAKFRRCFETASFGLRAAPTIDTFDLRLQMPARHTEFFCPLRIVWPVGL